MKSRFISIHSTAGDEKTARAIAGILVSERLAACVQVEGPLLSVYRWKGAVENAEEWRMVIKTRASLFDRVVRRIRENHPYEVPEIVAFPVADGSKDYLDWIDDSTN